MNDQLSRQLREAAEAHQPDRARMLARVAGSARLRASAPPAWYDGGTQLTRDVAPAVYGYTLAVTG